jgi:hypothetical protein
METPANHGIFQEFQGEIPAIPGKTPREKIPGIPGEIPAIPEKKHQILMLPSEFLLIDIWSTNVLIAPCPFT